MWITDKLIELGFTRLGSWHVSDGELAMRAREDARAKLDATHVLYAFVLGQKVYYIGKTTRALKTRLREYAVGDPALKTNRKCHDNIRKLVEIPENRVEVLVFHKPDSLLHWGDIQIGLAAGLEDELIHQFAPPWNGSNKKLETESELVEQAATNMPPPPTSDVPAGADDDASLPSFPIGMKYTAHWDQGCINVPVALQSFVGAHGEPLKVYRSASDSEPIECSINRRAVTNRPQNPRIRGGKPLTRWYQKHFSRDDVVYAYIRDRHTVVLDGKAQ